jgi:hypothetical protein
LLAFGLQWFVGNTMAGSVTLWMAGLATVAATFSLIFRRLREEATRRHTEDKMVRDIQAYLTTPENKDSQTRPEVTRDGSGEAPAACGFQQIGSELQPEIPDPALVVLDIMPRRSRKSGDEPGAVFDKLEPLPENPML